MSKYHLTPDGPKICVAKSHCKYNSHFSNINDAQKVYEEKMEQAFGQFTSSKRIQIRKKIYNGIDETEKGFNEKKGHVESFSKDLKNNIHEQFNLVKTDDDVQKLVLSLKKLSIRVKKTSRYTKKIAIGAWKVSKAVSRAIELTRDSRREKNDNEKIKIAKRTGVLPYRVPTIRRIHKEIPNDSSNNIAMNLAENDLRRGLQVSQSFTSPNDAKIFQNAMSNKFHVETIRKMSDEGTKVVLIPTKDTKKYFKDDVLPNNVILFRRQNEIGKKRLASIYRTQRASLDDSIEVQRICAARRALINSAA